MKGEDAEMEPLWAFTKIDFLLCSFPLFSFRSYADSLLFPSSLFFFFVLQGGPERYADRGLIPRALSMLFNEARTRTDVQFKLYISYLELYNETGYDLLDPSHEAKALEDLPKVSMLEDEYGTYVQTHSPIPFLM